MRFSPDLYPGIFSPRPYISSHRTMFSLGCSCGRRRGDGKKDENTLPRQRGACFSYVVSEDGVRVCCSGDIMEYEGVGEEGGAESNSRALVDCEGDGEEKEEPEKDSRALVEYEDNGEEENESSSWALVEYEGNGEEEPEKDSRALVEYDGNGEEEQEKDSRALVKCKSTEAAAPERDVPRSLLERRGRSLTRLHLALSNLASTGSTEMITSGDLSSESSLTNSSARDSGDYEFINRIAIDGEGVIDLLRTRGTRQLVVRKTVDHARSAYAKPIEAAILQDVLPHRHDNIIRLDAFESYRLEGARYYFEYCPGGDLHELVNQYRNHGAFIPEPFIWHVYRQLLSALDFLHRGFDPRCPDPDRRGICHRDMKPSNVFLRPNPNAIYPDVVLADFGHATLDFATYVPAGTTIWQPPELPRHSPKGDVYSLGAIIHFLIHLRPPVDRLPDGFPDTASVKEAWMAAPEARRPIMEFVDGYSEDLVAMMLIALEADESKRKNSSRLLQYVSECVEKKFPSSSDSMRKAGEAWPLASWALDGDIMWDEERTGAGTEQYFEMMERFECSSSRESSRSSSSARSDWSSGVDWRISRGSEMSAGTSLGEAY